MQIGFCFHSLQRRLHLAYCPGVGESLSVEPWCSPCCSGTDVIYLQNYVLWNFSSQDHVGKCHGLAYPLHVFLVPLHVLWSWAQCYNASFFSFPFYCFVRGMLLCFTALLVWVVRSLSRVLYVFGWIFTMMSALGILTWAILLQMLAFLHVLVRVSSAFSSIFLKCT